MCHGWEWFWECKRFQGRETYKRHNLLIYFSSILTWYGFVICDYDVMCSNSFFPSSAKRSTNLQGPIYSAMPILRFRSIWLRKLCCFSIFHRLTPAFPCWRSPLSVPSPCPDPRRRKRPNGTAAWGTPCHRCWCYSSCPDCCYTGYTC